MAGILYCILPELLRAKIVDIAEHSDVGFGNNIAHWSLSDTFSMFVTYRRGLDTIAEAVAVLCKLS